MAHTLHGNISNSEGHSEQEQQHFKDSKMWLFFFFSKYSNNFQHLSKTILNAYSALICLFHFIALSNSLPFMLSIFV